MKATLLGKVIFVGACTTLLVLPLFLPGVYSARATTANAVPNQQSAIPFVRDAQTVPAVTTTPDPVNCRRSLDQWARHLIDDNRPGRAAFLYFADLDRDGVDDVVTGGFWYRNVRSITGPWVRQAIGAGFDDTIAIYDFDGDQDLDLLGTAGANNALPFVWARNDGAGAFTLFTNLDSNLSVPAHTPIQGVAVAHFQPDGPLEVALSWDKNIGGLQMLTVPADPTTGLWTRRQASPFTQGEALSTADLDHDGDLDLFTGTAWLRNDWPNGNWTPIHIYHHTSGDPDRNELVDMDGDGDMDAVVGYGHDEEAKVAWYEQPASPSALWTQHLIANLTTPTVAFPQNLDVGDLDGDGDLDVATAQHRWYGDLTVLQSSIWENVDGQGRTWAKHLLFTGDEHHDGMQLFDVEGDGDLDIVSIGWMHGRVMLYENRSTPCAAATPTATPTISPTTMSTVTVTVTVSPQVGVDTVKIYFPLVRQ
jgi:hypothetical protein